MNKIHFIFLFIFSCTIINTNYEKFYQNFFDDEEISLFIKATPQIKFFLKNPQLIKTFANSIIDFANFPSKLIQIGFIKPVRIDLIENPAKKIWDEVKDKSDFVPRYFSECIKKGEEWKKNGMKNIPTETIEEIKKEIKKEGKEIDSGENIENLMNGNIQYILTGGLIIMLCIEYFEQLKIDMKVEIQNPVTYPELSAILLPPTSDIIHTSNWKIIIDFGGDDTYYLEDGDYIIIDFKGNDYYKGNGSPFSYQFIVDREGNDVVECQKLCGGAGFVGVGAYIDLKGDDKYIVEEMGEGFGFLGIGILLDFQGDDEYETFSYSQGAGYIGTGILIDFEGNDKYVAKWEPLKNPAFQDRTHNISMAQGMGIGKRGDFSDGKSFGGGLGVLIDFKGSDYYKTDVFGKGCAFWDSVGIFMDLEGNDEYNGYWYSQGCAAHFAIGYFLDKNGNDKHSSVRQSLGFSNDYSVAIFEDEEGNDQYYSELESIGSSAANALSIFIDKKGNDKYFSKKFPFSEVRATKGWRKFRKTLGIFIDLQGLDSYNNSLTQNNSFIKNERKNGETEIFFDN